MVSARVLKDILQQPLGPYHDRDILDETACQMKGNSELVLYSFVLELNGRVTGLDESETPLDGRDNRRFRFRGILEITNSNWLSEIGKKTIETELNLRASERALREGERNPPQLTSEGLFGYLMTSSDATSHKENETRLMVLIQGEKNMPATFMHSTYVPNGLLWSSQTHNRCYQVATMDVETYSRSENFFWRWRLFALMDKIVKQYPYVPTKKRTPIWFVEKYMERFACPPIDRHRRLICDEDDTDADETGKTKTPRHLLRPHTSEILGLFAAQVDWFITNNEMKRKKLFDITSWENFAKEVRKERKEAARRGVKWGWPIGEEPEEEFSEEDERDSDGLEGLIRRNPVIGKANKTVMRKIQLAQARPNRESRASVSSGSGSEGEAPGVAEYVSDFSEPSDVEENDADHWPVEEEGADQIPWQLQLTPLLPDVDGRWWCPLQGCNHQIDLHNLTQDEKSKVPEDIMAYILQKQWRNAAYDDKVLQGFGYMVTNHYFQHLGERGVKVEKKETRIRFTLVNSIQRRHGGEEPTRGPMPARGTLGGESRVVPIVHATQAGSFP